MPRLRVRASSYLFAFGFIALFLILAHGPLLRLPYFWDESGQFIPASLDLLRSGAWIPVSTVPNIHPPGLMLWLAEAWKIFGYSTLVTRVAMLLVASGGALACFLLAIELSRQSIGTPAFTAVSLLCLSPLFFAQSMLAQLDMPAMALTALALLLFLQNHHRAAAATCIALVLVKETGIVAPAVFAAWLIAERRFKLATWYVLPAVALLAWLAVLHHGTGSWFGNRAFETYNLQYPMRPDRLVFALVRRAYYLFFSTGHFIGTAALVYAYQRTAIFRQRSWHVVASFVAAHIVAMSLFGGAVLERYLLPVLPIAYIAFAIALRSLLPRPRILALTGLILCLVTANFMNPVYSFPFENNLAFVSFVQLEQEAVADAEFTGGTVASAFPVADALRNPDLGYVNNPPKVLEIADFSKPEVDKLKAADPSAVIVYSRTWDPFGLLNNPTISHFLADHYGFQAQLAAPEVAAELHMHVAAHWRRRGLTISVLRRGEHLRL